MVLVRNYGVREETRNGPALVIPEPVMTIYERPMERVLLDLTRDVNPFFHLMKSLWMLSGRRDVASLDPFIGTLKKYSDDGETYHGAYGYRWRHFFGHDQLSEIIQILRDDPTTRRAVLTMWDPDADLGGSSKDHPCNTQIYFRVTGGVLDMTICCRSNDAIWGAYGANAVHMSVLQEFMAAASGLVVGRMYQLSNNLHAYVDVFERLSSVVVDQSSVSLCWENQYESERVHVTPLFLQCPDVPVAVIMAEIDGLWGAITRLWDAPGNEGVSFPQDSPVLTEELRWSASMMVTSYWCHRHESTRAALRAAELIPGSDWHAACTQWIDRHAKAS